MAAVNTERRALVKKLVVDEQKTCAETARIVGVSRVRVLQILDQLGYDRTELWIARLRAQKRSRASAGGTTAGPPVRKRRKATHRGQRKPANRRGHS